MIFIGLSVSHVGVKQLVLGKEQLLILLGRFLVAPSFLMARPSSTGCLFQALWSRSLSSNPPCLWWPIKAQCCDSYFWELEVIMRQQDRDDSLSYHGGDPYSHAVDGLIIKRAQVFIENLELFFIWELINCNHQSDARSNQVVDWVGSLFCVSHSNRSRSNQTSRSAKGIR